MEVKKNVFVLLLVFYNNFKVADPVRIAIADGSAGVQSAVLPPHGRPAGRAEGLQEQAVHLPRWFVYHILMSNNVFKIVY